MEERVHLPRASNTLVETAKGVWRMVVRYPVWDISYDVAISFTLGMIARCLPLISFTPSHADSPAPCPPKMYRSVTDTLRTRH